MLREVVLLWLSVVGGIITQNEVSLRKPNERGPLAVQSAIKCLHAVEIDWLSRVERLTRSSNLGIAYVHNDSFPALKISEEYIKFKNELATDPINGDYQIRIFSSYSKYKRIASSSRILLIDYYVIITDEVKDIRFLIESYLSPAPSWNPGARFLILYNNVNNQSNAVGTAKEIFDILLKQYYVHKVIMLYAVGVTNYSIHVFDPFDENNCRKVVVENASSCDNGVIANTKSYQSTFNHFRKSSLLKNCTLHLCLVISKPFINDDCDGIEIELLNILQGKLQFDVSFCFYLLIICN